MNSKELIEKIKTEIERIRNQSAKELGDAFLDSNEPKVMASGGIAWTCEQLLSFLNTLKTEEPIVDLEEAAEKCIESLIPETELNSTTPFALEYVVELLHKAFNAGMQEMREQIIKDAVDGTMGFVSIHLKKPNFGEKFKEGDKVKVLVIKEE